MTDEPRPTPSTPGELAERAVAALLRMMRRANALAGGVLVVVAFVCLASFAAGLAALSDGLRSVWIVVGGFFAIVAIGSVVVAMVRLHRVRRTSEALVDEVAALISGDRRNERIVIETIEASDAAGDDSAIVASRSFSTMAATVSTGASGTRALGEALRAITTFPALILLAALVSFVFAVLGLLFLIALAL